MSNEIIESGTRALLAVPDVGVTVRLATLADVSWIDSMQKRDSKALGWMPTAQIEGKIAKGNVLVAESVDCGAWNVEANREVGGVPPQSTFDSPRSCTRLGYIIGQDQYFKRDDVGIIYAINVESQGRRKCVAATLVKALIERSAWGCRLYSCWVAQDLEANAFWEAMGFQAIAFRTGSSKKSRTHIFWQMRVRAGDTATPYWFPSQTTGGAIREDRLVLPIPPGVNWFDPMPSVLPAVEGPRSKERATRKEKSGLVASRLDLRPRPPLRGLWFAPEVVPVEKPKREKKKNDPKLIAAAREIRDKWLELQGGTGPSPVPLGKYVVGKAIEEKAALPRLVA